MTKLFDGELIIKESGLYTLAHLYQEPISGRRVILIGANHGGDRPYFEAINWLLADCDLVLYENVGGSSDSIEEAAKDLELTFSANIEEAYLSALRTYFFQASRFLQFTLEHRAFSYNLPHWVCADIEVGKSEIAVITKQLTNALRGIPQSRKKEIVDYVIEQLTKIEKNSLTKEDYARGFAVIYSDPMITRIFTSVLVEKRDQNLFEIFDRLVAEKNSRLVGIKFGAAHTSHQRKLLEERGYKLTSSKELRNIAF